MPVLQIGLVLLARSTQPVGGQLLEACDMLGARCPGGAPVFLCSYRNP